MTFLDKLGEKLTLASKDVAMKAKDITDIAKINVQMLAEEDHLDCLYMEIGKNYYKNRNNSPDTEMMKLFVSIEDSKKKIQEFKQEINKLKRVKICPRCSTEVSETAKFCSNCSAPLE